MDQKILDQIGGIHKCLESTLGTINGNFSIKQQLISDLYSKSRAVLLKICQLNSQNKKQLVLVLMIDEHACIGVCPNRVIKQGINPFMTTNCQYLFDEDTFDLWIKSHLEHQLAA